MSEQRSTTTATVLCTDLVDSTVWLATLGEEAFDAFRRRHFDLLRAAVAGRNGREVKTLGDGMLAVFSSAADALACAVAVRSAVAAAADGPVAAVRIGLALGDVAVEDGDVFGTPVVQAARLTAAARGGQILATTLVRSVAGGRSSAACHEIGTMTLKGLPDPVAVCEVGPEGALEGAGHDGSGRGVVVRLLGPVDVAAAGRAVEIGSAQQRALLGALALRPGEVLPAETLAAVVWDDHPPATAPSTLRALLARLRRTLETGAGSALVRGREPGYLLDVTPDQVDAVRFEALAARGRHELQAGRADSAAAALAEAVGLWRGPALGDLATWRFAQVEARRLDDARAAAVEDLADAELRLARPLDALARLETLVAQHPLRERGWGLLMLARYRLGRQDAALAAYRQVRAVLAEELGVEPTPALRDLHTRILHQAPDLDLRSDGTSARLAARTRHNLPKALTSFVGRTRELAELSELLCSARLVTVAGVGGAGKTRVAVAAAEAAGARHADGVRLVELAPIRDPEAVVSAAAAAIGFDAADLAGRGQPLLDALCRQIGGRALLLVLDNCEHLVDAAADLARAVLGSCPEVVVLATSREVLGLPGEVVYRIPPLSLPQPQSQSQSPAVEHLLRSDAVALFCDRARAAEPSFALTEANGAAVAEICRRLDGIPLALELAAARVRVLGTRKVAGRLRDRLDLLVGGPRGNVTRHQTLRSAIDWSFELLSGAEQALLAHLSVFPGSFDLEAAEAVGAAADAGRDVLDLLTRLVDKSLVVVVRDDEDVRYDLLETVREYAAEKLVAAGAAGAAHSRHREHFLAVARRWEETGFYANALTRAYAVQAAADDHNFRAAIERADADGDAGTVRYLSTALAAYWLYNGQAHWVERFKQSAAEGEAPTLRARVFTRHLLSYVLGQPWSELAQPGGLLDEAVQLAAAAGDEPALLEAQIWLVEARCNAGDAAGATELGAQVVVRATALGLHSSRAWALHYMSWAALRTGRSAEAAEGFRTALRVLEDCPDELGIAQNLAVLGLAEALRGEVAEAERVAADAVRAARRFPLPLLTAMALVRASQTAVLSGHPERAGREAAEALVLLRELGTRRWVGEALESCVLSLAQADADTAARLLGAAEQLHESVGKPGFHLADALEDCRAHLVAHLGDEPYEAAYEAGRALDVDAAIAFALARLNPSGQPA